jgi:nitrous oxide reductase accessory protein NosL
MKRTLAAAAAVLCLLAAGCTGSDDAAMAGRPAPPAAATGLDADGHMHAGPDDRCPVCAMTVADKKLGSAVELADGRTWYTCGTGCLLKCWRNPEFYLGAGEQPVRRAVTRDFFTGEALDAAAAVWVAGSDVVGPMGPMIVPLANAEDAARFRERHGGTLEFRLEELDDALWERITGRQAASGG